MNMFTAIAKAREENGEDMQEVVRELCQTLRAVIIEGVGKDDAFRELMALWEEAGK